MTRSDAASPGRSVVAVLLVGVLLVAALPIAGGAAAGDRGGPAEDTSHGSVGPESLDGDGSAPAADGDRGFEPHQVDDEDAIRLRNELFATDEAGTVGVETRVTIPDRVTEFRVTLLSANDAAVEADGFVPADDAAPGETSWEWDGQTATPSLTYAMDANETVEEAGPLGARGSYRFVDTGEWALVRTPRTSAGWSYTGQYDGQVRLTRENAVDGEGAASQAIAFLGPHEERVREAGGQRYRLIVPAAADAEATPEEVFGVFESASTALQVGARDETVFAVAAPTDGVEWGVRGLQLGDTDLWVRDAEPAGTASDVWTHEYVHTRQAYGTEASGRWLTEASATYYAALFALDRGAVDFEAFEETLARGERDPDASAVLADPDTWGRDPDYTKGALVAGEIDRRLRVATDGSASLATVLRDLNAASEPVTNRDVLDAIEAAAAEGADDETAAAIRAEAERLTTTREATETWDREAHAEAFGETPARVGYALPDDGVRATGEYRDRSVASDPVELVAGETLALAVDVTNTGGVAGEYDLALTVDGEVVDSRNSSVDAGAATTEEFEHAFAEPGEYVVRVAGERLPVVVSEPAPPSVRGVSTDADRVTAGESVRVTATVGNDATLPAGSDIEFRVGGETVATAPVRLDADGQDTIARTVALGESDGSGGLGADRNATVTVVGPINEASTTVTVEGEDPPGGATDDGTPGFGPVVAVAAFVVAAGLFGRRAGRGP
ncbi:PGF-CTERM sorting domain-containing protein [Halorubrum yunnanense]|uniref:PGF-CTERM sorting domain-containing protein n=1 Tax=Halorubrum yunnanense TaxID=1526162 RepID=A0ABD5Y877_9EURY|nr:PGF-CTERM sorting domain-containing protein [Halorubrum yunnanense]